MHGGAVRKISVVLERYQASSDSPMVSRRGGTLRETGCRHFAEPRHSESENEYPHDVNGKCGRVRRCQKILDLTNAELVPMTPCKPGPDTSSGGVKKSPIETRSGMNLRRRILEIFVM